MAGEGESAIGVLQRVVIITTITPAAGKLATASDSEMCAAAPEQQEAEGARRVRVLLQGMEVEVHLQQAHQAQDTHGIPVCCVAMASSAAGSSSTAAISRLHCATLTFCRPLYAATPTAQGHCSPPLIPLQP